MSQDCISNFHTHTALCGHASGMPADYVRQAEKDGCSALGFSDHCPYPAGSGDFWPEIRMTAEQAPSYLADVRSAAEAVPFPVYAGFECEWDKDYESWYREELSGRLGADYLVLGSHWVTEGRSHVYAMDISSPQELHRYIDQTIDGIRSGLYSFLAHPDLFMGKWREWDADAEACLSALLDAAADCGLPIEINGLGMRRAPNMTRRGQRFQYPYEEFWQMAARDRRVKVLCNSDAHDPADVIRNARGARAFAERLGIVPLERPEKL